MEGSSLSPELAQLGDNGGAHGTTPLKPIPSRHVGVDARPNLNLADIRTHLFPFFSLLPETLPLGMVGEGMTAHFTAGHRI